MSIDLKGQQCPVCKAYLFEDDDVVFCPTCGAPHHRECYQKIGHCALEELHGTEFEYGKAKAQQNTEEKREEPKENNEQKVLCPFCYNEYPSEMRSCPHCGRVNAVSGFGVGFDPLGNVPADFKISEEVSAKEAAKFVLSASNRYVPKFAKFSAGSKISWNWAAFLLPEGWALHRKMTKLGVISIALIVIAALFRIPMYMEYETIVESFSGQATMETYAAIASQLANTSAIVQILSFVAFGLELATRFFLALFGDYLYYKYTLNTLKEIKQENAADFDEQVSKRGGSNLFLLLLGVLVASYLPQVLMYVANLF